MRPNANKLAMRDPALAALLGVVAVKDNSDFGGDFGADFGDDDMGDDDMGDDDYGSDDDLGADFGAAVVRRPSQAALVKLARQRKAALSKGAARNRLLNPNAGSALKVEKYAFTISQAITLGTAAAFTTLTGQPDTTIRPQRVSMNAPTPMYAFVQEIKVANVSVTIGTGLEDAFNYNANGVGQQLDMPTLSPANKATVLGSYTGYIPPGFVGATATYFSVSFRGPSTIVG